MAESSEAAAIRKKVCIMYPPQKEFELARAMLHDFVGLNLCLTEQVILKRIVGATIDVLVERNAPVFRPATEAAVRFLFQEYGISWLDKDLYDPVEHGYYSEQAAQALNFLQGQRQLI